MSRWLGALFLLAGVAPAQIIVPITISPDLPPGTINQNYFVQFSASGGSGAYRFSYSGATIPGLNFSPSQATLSGFPTAADDYGFTITATDAQTGRQGSRLYTLPVRTPVVVGGAPPNGQLGVPYSHTFSRSGGQPPYTFYNDCSTPPGLNLNASTGVLSGTPTQAGNFSYCFGAFDVQDRSSNVLTGTIAIAQPPPPTINPAAPPEGTEGTPYSFLFTASNGLAPLTWSISGVLPPGLSFSSANNTGILSGTPTATATSTVNVTVVDSLRRGDTRAFTITIRPRVQVTITTTSPLPDAPHNRPYSIQFSAVGGATPYAWSITGNVPAGLSFDPATGVLAGIATNLGTYGFAVTARDANGIAGQKTFSLRVVPPELEIVTTSVPPGQIGVPYSFGFVARGGVPPYTWTAQQGVPPGLALRPDGLLTGTPTTEGVYRLSVLVSDIDGRQVGFTFEVRITGAGLALDPTNPLSGRVGVAYQHQFRATGGTQPYAFAVTVGSLPTGLQLDAATGAVSGTPTVAGAFTFTLRVTDASQATASLQYTITINPGGLSITTTELPNGTVGVEYLVALAATGGRQPYTWAVADGNLPAGFVLNPRTGAIAGNPQAEGRSTFTVRVTDASEQTASRAFTIVITGRLQITTPPPLTGLVVGVASNLVIAASGGVPPYTFTVTGGALPAGLRLESDGRITGTPSAAGAFSVTIQVRDTRGQTASRDYTGTVVAGVVITTAANLPEATVGSRSAVTLAATGGTPPYRWQATGNLPGGVTLSGEGVLTIAPTSAGQSSFAIQVTDAANRTASRTFNLTVRLPALSGVTVNVPEAPPAFDQTRVTISTGSPFPGGDIAGTARITFTSDAAVNADDPAIQFATGGRTATFRIPAGTTEAVFTTANQAIQTGTVAGTITLAVTLESGGVDVPCNDCQLTRTIRIPRSAPVIRGVRIVATGSGFNLEVTGFSTSREITQATFRFTGSNLGTTEVTVPVGPVFLQWYQSGQSAQFGSQFLLTQPFTVAGSTADITSVQVTLTNAVGTSQPATANFR